ncbi:glycosyltransferase family 1 protein [Vibrio sp. SM6]|uniref:Glycosyltransferase family 1 protein n=1 Tax=Vibrio agarilyticus TaxID=2726741 RepID=A0A7X8TPE4_9VIBR|nr:glycosyltransferase [Vibrio agarilyticus]NLS12485.1 glycosyltransferase family 1 protein [Vibrio agarilyticus]
MTGNALRAKDENAPNAIMSTTTTGQKMNILFLSHTYIGCHYVVGSHHLSKALAEMGHRVVHIPHPWSSVHQIVRGSRRNLVTGELSPNRWQFQIGGFLPSKWHMLALNFDNHSKNLANEILSYCDEINISTFDYCFVDDPVFCQTCKYLPINKMVYRPTDIYPEMPQGKAYKKADRLLMENSSRVVATNEQILKYHGMEDASNTFVLNNGFDPVHFSSGHRPSTESPSMTSDSDSTNKMLSVCYVGALDKRFDYKLLNAAAAACKEVKFDIYSPSDAGPLNHELPNIHCLGAVDYQTLPSVLTQYDLLIMPFTFDLSNRGRSPMKLFEYAASNVPILAPSYMNTFGIEDVTLYANLDEFIAALKKARINPQLNRDMDILKPHSWTRKAELLLEFVEGDVS